MRISDWSSDVCSSGLGGLRAGLARRAEVAEGHRLAGDDHRSEVAVAAAVAADLAVRRYRQAGLKAARHRLAGPLLRAPGAAIESPRQFVGPVATHGGGCQAVGGRRLPGPGTNGSSWEERRGGKGEIRACSCTGV